MEGNWYDHKLYQSKNYLERYFRMWRMDFRMGEKIEERSLQNLNHLLPTSSTDCSSLMRNDQSGHSSITAKVTSLMNDKLKTTHFYCQMINLKHQIDLIFKRIRQLANITKKIIVITGKEVAGRNDRRSRPQRRCDWKACWSPWWNQSWSWIMDVKHGKRRGIIERNQRNCRSCCTD